MLMLRETARKAGAFPEQANCNGVIWSCHREKAIKVPVPSHKQLVTDADSPP